jgi:DNA-binding NarL/FixJ family response regulator
MNVSVETAKSHRKRILRKLDARTIGQAISIAFVTFTFRIDAMADRVLERSRAD